MNFSPQLKSEIAGLWKSEPFGSPFVSPSFLELMFNRIVAKGERVVFSKGYDNTGKLVGLWPMRVDRQKRMRFLQYCFCDYSTPLYDFRIAIEDLADGLFCLIRTVEPSSMVLDTVPDWGFTLQAVTRGLERTGYKVNAFPCASAPVLRGRLGPEGIGKLKKQLCRHRSLKNYTNRLKREKGFFFEVDPGTRGIDAWADQFCAAHLERWKSTLTPSKYHSKQAREDFKDVLHAWAEDNLLIRFSIFVLGRRITFAAGLKSGNTIVYFHTARRPVYNKLGTGNITIRLIGLWMIENGYDSMDFGQGDEGYKYYFANESRELWRIYASKSCFSSSYLRGGIEEYIRRKENRVRTWERVKKSMLMIKRFFQV
ncbi:MAG: GNAT family N-acetyltransferase [Desulfobacterales bacterium]|nr:GNAT family N-acetyltransferase [Desulfobacterales bacterium]